MISKKDTLFLKGLAILIMVYHHNWYTGPLFSVLQSNARIIVWIFLFITAYGYTSQLESLQKKYPVRFIIKRLALFYIPFWICSIVVLLIDLLANPGETISFYTGSPLIWIIDFFSLSQYFGTPAFVGGWYTNMLVLLIVLFPLIHFVVSKVKWFAIPITLIIVWFFKWKIYYEYGGYLDEYLMIVVIGILFYKYKVFSYLPKIKSIWRIPLTFLAVLVMLAALCLRNEYIPYVSSTLILRFDPLSTILALAVIAGVYILRNDDKVSLVFEKLGRHSANIFYIHSVFYNTVFPVWGITNPFITFGLCFTMSLAISILIEKIKDLTGFNSKLRTGVNRLLRIQQ